MSFLIKAAKSLDHFIHIPWSFFPLKVLDILVTKENKYNVNGFQYKIILYYYIIMYYELVKADKKKYELVKDFTLNLNYKNNISSIFKIKENTLKSLIVMHS